MEKFQELFLAHEGEESLLSIFIDEEEKEKFYALIKEYLYDNWNGKVAEIIEKAPSQRYLNIEAEKERKKQELENEKQEAKILSEAEKRELLRSLNED